MADPKPDDSGHPSSYLYPAVIWCRSIISGCGMQAKTALPPECFRSREAVGMCCSVYAWSSEDGSLLGS